MKRHADKTTQGLLLATLAAGAGSCVSPPQPVNSRIDPMYIFITDQLMKARMSPSPVPAADILPADAPVDVFLQRAKDIAGISHTLFKAMNHPRWGNKELGIAKPLQDRAMEQFRGLAAFYDNCSPEKQAQIKAEIDKALTEKPWADPDAQPALIAVRDTFASIQKSAPERR